jgi:hypothetical protein
MATAMLGLWVASLNRPKIRIFVITNTSPPAGASYAPDHRRAIPALPRQTQEIVMSTKTKLLALALTALTLATTTLTAAEARVTIKPPPHFPVSGTCALPDCGAQTPPKPKLPTPPPFPAPGSVIILPTAPPLPGSNLGGGGFGTVLPGGGNLENCQEEWRCDGSVF